MHPILPFALIFFVLLGDFLYFSLFFCIFLQRPHCILPGKEVVSGCTQFYHLLSWLWLWFQPREEPLSSGEVNATSQSAMVPSPSKGSKKIKDTDEFCPQPWLRIFFQIKLIQLRGRLDLGIILLESASLSFLSILTFFTSPNTLFSLICEHVRWSSHRLSPGPGLAATHNSSRPCF